MSILFMYVFISSCKSKKVIVKTTTNVEVIDTVAEKLKYYNNELIKNIPDYSFLSFKINTEYSTDDQKMSFKSQVRFKKDSLIWISVTPILGIEAARVLINTDSVFILNRLQGSAMLYSMNELSNRIGYPLTVNTIQNILIGQSFIPLTALDTPILKIDSAGTLIHSLVSLANYKKYDYKILLDKENKIIHQSIRNLSDQIFADINCTDYKTLSIDSNYMRIPTKYKYDITFEKPINIINEYNKIESKECEFPFSIPGKYERIKF